MNALTFATTVLIASSQVSANTMPCLQVIDQTHKSLLDVESADPDVVVEVCGAAKIACAYPFPTPKHPDRVIVLYSNDYVGEEVKCIIARAAKDVP
jgi:hypothetical protein